MFNAKLINFTFAWYFLFVTGQSLAPIPLGQYYAQNLNTSVQQLQLLIEQLQSKDPNTRKDAAEALGKLGEAAAVPALIIAAEDKEYSVREKAMAALGTIGDQRAVPILIKGLKDIFCKYTAVNALSKIKDKSAVPALMEAMEDPHLRAFAAGALGKIGDPIAIPVLIRHFDDTSEFVKISVIEALGELKAKEAVPLLLKNLNTNTETVIVQSIQSLGLIGAKEAVMPIIPMLKNPILKVRIQALEALGKLADKRASLDVIRAFEDVDLARSIYSLDSFSWVVDKYNVSYILKIMAEKSTYPYNLAKLLVVSIDKQIVPALLDALSDERIELQQILQDSLMKLADKSAVPRLIELLQNPTAKYSAKELLLKLADQEAIPALIAALSVESSQYAANKLLEKLADASAVPALIKVLSNKTAQYRAEKLLLKLADKQAIPELIAVLGDETAKVHAKELLLKLADSEAVPLLLEALLDRSKSAYANEILDKTTDNKAVQPLLEGLRHKNPLIQAKSKELLDRFVDHTAIPVLITYLNDPLPGIRAYAAAALGEIGDKSAIQALLKISKDENPTVQRNALNALKKLGVNTQELDKTYFELTVNIGHSDNITSREFSSDGKMYATSSDDKTIKLWNAKTGKLIRTFLGHTQAVKAVCFSPDNKTLLSGGSDGFLRVWDIETGETHQIIDIKKELTLENPDQFIHSLYDQEITAVAFSKDGTMIASGSRAGGIQLWDLQTKKHQNQLKGHTDQINTLKFMPDGQHVMSSSRDKSVKYWDIKTEKLVRSFAVSDPHYNYASLTFETSANGKFLLTRMKDTSELFEIESGKLIQRFEQTEGHALFSPDSQDIWLHKGEKNLSVWNIASKSERLTPVCDHNLLSTNPFHSSEDALKFGFYFCGDLYPQRQYVNPVYSVLFTPDSKQLLSGDLDNPTLWDFETGKMRRKFKWELQDLIFNMGPDQAMAIAKDGQKLLAGSTDHTLKLFDLKTGKELHSFEANWDGTESIHALAFSPDGKHALVGQGKTPQLLDLETGEVVRHFKGHGGYVQSLAISPDGQQFVSGSWGEEHNLKLWDIKTGKQIHDLIGHTDFVESVAFSSDGKKILSGGLDQTLRLWDASNGQLLKTIHTRSGIDALAFSGKDHMAITGDWDGILQIWDLEKGTESHMIKAHMGEITAIAFSPDGKTFASSGQDGTTRLWDFKSGKELVAIHSDEQGEYLIWTPDGYFDGSPNSSHLVHVVQGLEVFSIDQFALKYNRPDIILERLSSTDTERTRHYKQLYLRRLAKAGLSEAQLSSELHAPMAEIKDQKLNGKQLELNIDLSDSQYPLKAYNIYVNDVPIFGAEGKTLSTHDFKGKQNIELNAGENKIEVSVMNSRGAESYRAMTTATYNQQVKGDLYYLGFGVSKYQDQKLNLKYAHKDALDLGKTLEQLPEFKQVHTQIFTDDQATASHVKAAKAFLKQATVDDTVVLFISGHGMHEPKQNNQYYFLTHETDLTNISSTAASFEDLENLLQGIAPRRKLFLMDTCESGEQTNLVSNVNQQELQQKGLQIRGFEVDQAEAPKPIPEYVFEKNRFIHNDLFRRSGTVVLSSSQGGEFSYEPREWREDGNGYFTQAVIEGLKGLADQDRNQKLFKQELFDYVRERVKGLTSDKQHPGIDRDNLKQRLELQLK